MRSHTFLSIPVCAVLLAGLAGCSGSDTPPAQAQQPPSGATVNVTLREWGVFADKTALSSGSVTFTATNTGTVPHELVILKLNAGVTPDTMPVKGGVVDETASGSIIDEIEDTDLPPGATKSKTVTLPAGTYALFCAVVENDTVPPGTSASKSKVSHYLNGMFAKLTVS